VLNYWLKASLGCLAVGAGFAEPPSTEPPPADKSIYTLWNPTPQLLMREMSTDRPDRTESPFTVDAGHVQIELDLLSYTHAVLDSGPGSTRVDAFAFVPFNLKAGLCNSADLQILVPTYNTIQLHSSGSSQTDEASGFGDLVTRLKMNLWGNDGGATAFAMMPFLRLPTNTGGVGLDDVAGGIILPLGVELPLGWTMGTMLELDFYNLERRGFQTAVINSITFSHSIVGDLSGYVEFFSNLETGSGAAPWRATADCGLTYRITPNLQLDTGVNIGLTSASETANTFLGVSMRF